MPDNKNEHPQVGLDQADIVFVELDGYPDAAGYSSTRLVPVFHSHLPDDVAPVRSIRPVDVPLLSPVGAIIGSTGATGWVLNYVAHFGSYGRGLVDVPGDQGHGFLLHRPSRVRKTRESRTTTVRSSATQGRWPDRPRVPEGPAQAYFPFA